MAGFPEQEIRRDRVAIYIRWSTEEQAEGTTMAEQREGCEFYIRSQGWAVNPDLLFIDDGYSGGNLDRPAMGRLRDRVWRGEVDCVVVLKIDRLSRNIVDATQLVLKEWREKCHLRCVRQPIDTTSETGRLFFSILATFADFERAQITERTYQGRLRRIREGKAYGGPAVPYGLLATGEPGIRVLDPERAPVVAELFRQTAEEQATVARLRDWLVGRRIAPPAGRRWSLNTLRRMLQNPIYAGRIVYGRAAHIKQDGARAYRRLRRPIPLIEVDARTVPPIVTPVVFEEVQAIFRQRREFHEGHQRASDGANLLAGIARCRCGASMNIHWSRGLRYYRCSRQIMHGREGCDAGSGTLRAEWVEDAIRHDLLTSFGSREQRAVAVRRVVADDAGEAKNLEQEQVALRAELERLAGRLEELRRAAGHGELTAPEWRALTGAVEVSRADARRRWAEIQCRLEKITRSNSQERHLTERVAELDRWVQLPLELRKELLQALSESIELYKGRGRQQPYEIRVRWRFAPRP